MWERFQRFSGMELPARKLFLRAMALLPLVALSLRWRGFRATRAALQIFLSKTNREQDSAFVNKRAAMTAKMVHAADRRGLGHTSCLAKCLTLWWLHGRQGVGSQLRSGIVTAQ